MKRSIPGFIKPAEPLADMLESNLGKRRRRQKRPNYKNDKKRTSKSKSPRPSSRGSSPTVVPDKKPEEKKEEKVDEKKEHIVENNSKTEEKTIEKTKESLKIEDVETKIVIDDTSTTQTAKEEANDIDDSGEWNIILYLCETLFNAVMQHNIMLQLLSGILSCFSISLHISLFYECKSHKCLYILFTC